QIDVYAAGIILFEMLTGRVPFEGESAGEILMKHLTSPPDLSKLPPEFVPVVAKALAKNPAMRFASMAEMARAVEAVLKQASRPEPVRPAAPAPKPKVEEAAQPILTVLPVVSWHTQLAELCGSLALTTLFAGLATTLWAVPGQMRNWTEI